jgi:hypothetical protein
MQYDLTSSSDHARSEKHCALSHRSFLSAMGVQDVASARGQARMWDSTEAVAGLQEQLQQQRAASAALEQKYEA